MRLASSFALLVLAACPPRPVTPAASAAAPGAGCPSGAGVYVASYLTQDPGKGRTGWVLPLHAMQVDPAASEHIADYAPLDATAASVSGVPAGPTGTLWLITAGAAPCKATVGGYYTAKLPGPPASLSYGVELNGCPAPADPQEGDGLALVSELPPTGCQLQGPQTIAERVGEMDAAQHWQRPVKETPIPPVLAPVIPAHTCTAPACESLWSISQVEVEKRPVVWSGAFNWLQVDASAASSPCTWKNERFSGFWIPGPDGKPVKVDEGQTHPLVLSAVLVDQGGAKALLAEGPGEYATYDLAPGKATLARHVAWMLVSNDAWDTVDHLGPVCEKSDAAPAPLPKDAKPQSPY